MNIDEMDIKLLEENFDIDMIEKLDSENVCYIYKYLTDNGICYVKDLLITSLDLFLLPYQEFIRKFEILKEKVGVDFAEKMGEDLSLIEIMYE